MRTGGSALWPVAIGGSLAIHAGLAAFLAMVPAYAPPAPFDATISIESLSRALAESVPVTAAASSVATGVLAITSAAQGLLVTGSEDASLADRAEVESVSAANAPASEPAQPVQSRLRASPAELTAQPLVAAEAQSPDLLSPAISDTSPLVQALDDRVNATPAELPLRPAEKSSTPQRPAASPSEGDAIAPVAASERKAVSQPETELVPAEIASPDTVPASAVVASGVEPGRPAEPVGFAEAGGEAPTVLKQSATQTAAAAQAQREIQAVLPSSPPRRDAASPTVPVRTALAPTSQAAGTAVAAAPQAPLAPTPQAAGTAVAAAPQAPLAPSPQAAGTAVAAAPQVPLAPTPQAAGTAVAAVPQAPLATANAARSAAVAAPAPAGRASPPPVASPAKSVAQPATAAAQVPARLTVASPSVPVDSRAAVSLAPANATVVPAGKPVMQATVVPAGKPVMQAAVVTPLEPPSAAEEQTGGEASVRAFVAGYRGDGGCLLAVVAGQQADVTEVDSFTDLPAQADALGAEAARATGVAVSASARLVSAAQCSTLDFLRGLGGSGGASLVLSPDSMEIDSGQILAGSIANFTKPVRYLLVVDDEGQVQFVPGLTAVGADTVRFSAPMTLTSGPVRTVQILVAVGSDAPLESIEPGSSARANAYFPALIEEIARSGAEVEYGIAPFVVR